MSATKRWVIAIVGLLVANLTAMIVLLVSAHSGGGAQVIPGYYARAASYNDELDQAARNRALGWRVEVGLVGAVLTVAVRDAAGAAIEDASVRVAGYPRAHAERRFDDPAAVLPGGRYRATLPGTGRHDLRIAIERSGARFVERAAVEVR